MLYVCNIFLLDSPSQASLFEKMLICKAAEMMRPSVVAVFLLFLQYEAMYPLIVLKQVFEARL